MTAGATAPGLRLALAGLAGKLPRYHTVTPNKSWRHFLDVGGTLYQVEAALRNAGWSRPAVPLRPNNRAP